MRVVLIVQLLVEVPLFFHLLPLLEVVVADILPEVREVLEGVEDLHIVAATADHFLEDLEIPIIILHQKEIPVEREYGMQTLVLQYMADGMEEVVVQEQRVEMDQFYLEEMADKVLLRH